MVAVGAASDAGWAADVVATSVETGYNEVMVAVFEIGVAGSVSHSHSSHIHIFQVKIYFSIIDQSQSPFSKQILES